MTRRPTLADRNRTAIARLAPEPSATTLTPAALSRSEAPPAVAVDQPKPNPAKSVTVSVVLTDKEYSQAKGAFLSDWEHGGETNFTAWMHAVLTRYARLSVNDRATGHHQPSGSPRSFRLTPDIRAIVEQAIADDCATGNWTTMSAWVAAAIQAAIAAAELRGPLPTPPKRLPPQLPKRPSPQQRKHPR